MDLKKTRDELVSSILDLFNYWGSWRESQTFKLKARSAENERNFYKLAQRLESKFRESIHSFEQERKNAQSNSPSPPSVVLNGIEPQSTEPKVKDSYLPNATVTSKSLKRKACDLIAASTSILSRLKRRDIFEEEVLEGGKEPLEYTIEGRTKFREDEVSYVKSTSTRNKKRKVTRKRNTSDVPGNLDASRNQCVAPSRSFFACSKRNTKRNNFMEKKSTVVEGVSIPLRLRIRKEKARSLGNCMRPAEERTIPKNAPENRTSVPVRWTPFAERYAAGYNKKLSKDMDLMLNKARESGVKMREQIEMLRISDPYAAALRDIGRRMISRKFANGEPPYRKRKESFDADLKALLEENIFNTPRCSIDGTRFQLYPLICEFLSFGGVQKVFAANKVRETYYRSGNYVQGLSINKLKALYIELLLMYEMRLVHGIANIEAEKYELMRMPVAN